MTSNETYLLLGRETSIFGKAVTIMVLFMNDTKTLGENSE